MFDKLEAVQKRYDQLTEQMASPEMVGDYERLQALAKERAGLEEIVVLYRDYQDTRRGLDEAQGLLRESDDEELRELANQEIETLSEKRASLEEKLKAALLPKDPRDEKNVIVEIRAAEGGDEAALFAADLFRMYSRYAESRRWNVELISKNESGIGGLKEVIFQVQGRGAYSRLKYESGVHRVQRVPVTEASGRIHTSTATVAVLPEADEVDIAIDEKELRIDKFHASSAGGQNVNKVETAVRITHLPTGIVVTCQDERSQLKNRMKAMAVLRARLLDVEQSKQTEEITRTRRSQVGTGERAEKIRTYNFPQDRATDHRVGMTFHNLPAILGGELDEIIDAVATSEEAKLLETSIPQGREQLV